MKTKATPGPWHVVLSNNATPHIMHEHANDCSDCNDRASLVCVMPAEIMGHYNSLANARLIAAAPELYEVLSELEESCEYWSEYDVPLGIVERIKAALKKARGGQ